MASEKYVSVDNRFVIGDKFRKQRQDEDKSEPEHRRLSPLVLYIPVKQHPAETSIIQSNILRILYTQNIAASTAKCIYSATFPLSGTVAASDASFIF